MTGILGGKWTLETFEPMGDIPTGVKLTSYSGGSSDISTEQLQHYVELVEKGKLMIRSIRHKGPEKFFLKGIKSGIQAKHASKLRLILGRLNASINAQDMNLPGLYLHALSGDKDGVWSVRVSGNWRVTFRFVDGDAEIVNYEDYH